MNYREGLTIAGAYVHAYSEWGGWEGEWYAKVTFKNKSGWVFGDYGYLGGVAKAAEVIKSAKHYLKDIWDQHCIEYKLEEDREKIDWIKSNR